MEESIYYKIGGADTIKALVEYFYDGVFQNELLIPLFKNEKEEIKSKQFLFLSQFLGGPSIYSEKFGHPRLRARHIPHVITEEHAVEWLKCMHHAISKLAIDDKLKEELFARFPQTAFFMVNTPS